MRPPSLLRPTVLLAALCTLPGIADAQPAADASPAARQCSCGGPYVNDLCANLNPSDLIVLARVEAVDLGDGGDGPQRMRVDILERFTDEVPPGEATIAGADGGNCLADLTGFRAGDTLVLGLFDTSYYERTDYDLPGLCGRTHAYLTDGRVEGVDLATFRAQLPACIDQTLGAAEASTAPLLLWPNPADERVTVESPAAPILGYRLRDLTGRLVRAYGGPAVTEIDIAVAHLPPGTYVLHVSTADEHLRQRVCVAH